MNVKAIPSVNKAKTENNNVLQLAILSRIKLFVRPNNLAMQPEEALSQLRFERVGSHLKISNASPYYITLVNLKLGGQTLDNIMIAPKIRHSRRCRLVRAVRSPGRASMTTVPLLRRVASTCEQSQGDE